ncbi:hypothetical protein C1H46_043096 [Malus baccata]|uniref:Pentatricopeptide repeat-containing protein n=1 Tax=Malus baccata TaxID=106549 RepID=A0A540KAY3_MALBA|nr:hypothetical protein C1H46_043096 [Malus baccata]
MLVSLRPKSFPGLPDLRISGLKWLSNAAATQNPEDNLRSFFTGRMNPTQTDYELALVSDLKSRSSLAASFQGQQIHSLVLKAGLDSNNFIRNSLINTHAKCGFIADAELLFDSCYKLDSGVLQYYGCWLFDKIHVKDVASWGTRIDGYVQVEWLSEALMMYRAMLCNGLGANDFMLVDLISACGRSKAVHEGTLKEARWADKYIVENSIPLNDNLSAALIDMYAKCGSINTALEVLFQIRDKTSTVSPWNAIICGSAMYGHAKLSLEIFSDLQKRYIKLNSITFIGVLSACCHAGFMEAGESLERGEMAAESLTRLQPSHGPVKSSPIQFIRGCREVAITVFRLCGQYILQNLGSQYILQKLRD